MGGVKRAVLVTGGAGYIGAHICKRLSAAGLLPVTLDDCSTGHVSAVQWGPLIEASIANIRAVQQLCKDYAPIAVIHAAALSDAAESVEKPQLYWTANVAGTAALREVLGNVPWVFSSSAAIYGDASGAITEDRSPSPLNPYGASKLECEGLLPAAMRLRYFNVAGADEHIGLGHKPETHLIPRVLRAALNGQVFQIYGSGEAARDFVHVADVAEANIHALRYLLAGGPGRPVNVCSGVGSTVTDVVRLATRITGRKIAVTHAAARDGDPERAVGCNEVARDVFGWSPKRDLAEQMLSAWRWISREPARAA